MEQKEKSPREKAELILEWARTHIPNPCGRTDEEKEFMRKRHRSAVGDALREPGVKETLIPEEIEELQGLLGN